MGDHPEEQAGSRGRPPLTAEQRELAARNRALVGVHLKNRVPTPPQPTRYREYDDLFQEGCLGLLRAAARYDPKCDGPFAAFALPRIRGAVHAALHSRFTLIPVPVRAARRFKEARHAGPSERAPSTQEYGVHLDVPTAGVSGSGEPAETVRHALRRRFELAVAAALVDCRGRRWRQRDPCDIMARVAAERLLIDDERQRTPLRRIAREFGVSSGRASDYEQQLMRTVAEHLARDPRVPVLLQFARQDENGLDAIIDVEQRERLRDAEVEAFADRFAAMEPLARAQAMYAMIERSTACVREVARSLFRLTLTMDDEAMRTVA